MTPSSAPADAASSDLASARAAWRLGLAEELAEIGMDLARDLRRQVTEAAEGAAEGAAAGAAEGAQGAPRAAAVDPGLAFSRLSRAVRVTLMLHEQLDQACAARAAALQAEAARRAAEAAQARDRRQIDVAVRGMILKGFVRQTIEDRLDRGERLEAEPLLDRLDRELLETDEAELLDRPLGELVERVCADLGLAFDWSALSDDELVELEVEPKRVRLCARSGAAGGEAGVVRRQLAGAGLGRAPP